MRHLTAQMVADAINRAPNLFDSHDAEKSALRLHPVATAQEIVAKGHTNDPLRYFSAAFAQYVDRTFGGPGGQITKTSRVNSENLGGLPNMNQQWRKPANPVVVPVGAIGGEDEEVADLAEPAPPDA